MKTSEIALTDVEALEKFETEENSDEIQENINELGLMIKSRQLPIVRTLNKAFKRSIDIIGGIVGLIFLIPLTIIVAIVNWLNHDFGPIFYSQIRIGKDGKKFKIYKFRTMLVNADEILKKLLKENAEMRKEWQETRKLQNDPRITPIGKILRKTSLDEFPQFVNVLIGNMSLVGPRAVIEDEVEMFGEYASYVFSVKPGITGYWSVSLFANNLGKEVA